MSRHEALRRCAEGLRLAEAPCIVISSMSVSTYGRVWFTVRTWHPGAAQADQILREA